MNKIDLLSDTELISIKGQITAEVASLNLQQREMYTVHAKSICLCASLLQK